MFPGTVFTFTNNHHPTAEDSLHFLSCWIKCSCITATDNIITLLNNVFRTWTIKSVSKSIFNAEHDAVDLFPLSRLSFSEY